MGSACALMACSPALNWRAIHLNGLAAVLPCKPDHAKRQVQLGALNVVMEMTGCEVNGALYAISYVPVGTDLRAETVLTDWRRQTLAAMRAETVQDASLPLSTAAGPIRTGRRVVARGLRPDGSDVFAQLVWLNSGTNLYHVAVYANPISEDVTEMYFSSLRLL